MGKKRGKTTKGKKSRKKPSNRKKNGANSRYARPKDANRGVRKRNVPADPMTLSELAGHAGWPQLHAAIGETLMAKSEDWPDGDPTVQYGRTWMWLMMRVCGAPVKTVEGFMRGMECEGYTPDHAMRIMKNMFDEQGRDSFVSLEMATALERPFSESTKIQLEAIEEIHPEWREWGDDFEEKYPIPEAEHQLNMAESLVYFEETYPEHWEKMQIIESVQGIEVDDELRNAWFNEYEIALNVALEKPLEPINSMLAIVAGKLPGDDLDYEEQSASLQKMRTIMLESESTGSSTRKFLEQASEPDLLVMMEDFQQSQEPGAWLNSISSAVGNWEGLDKIIDPTMAGRLDGTRKVLSDLPGFGWKVGEDPAAQGLVELEKMSQHMDKYEELGLLRSPLIVGEEEEDTDDEPTELGLPPPNTANRSLAGSISAADYESMMQAKAAESDFAGPTSAADYGRIMAERRATMRGGEGGDDPRPSLLTQQGGADPLVARRWEFVKGDGMDAAETYFDFLTSLHMKNCNIMGRASAGPGGEGDYATLFDDGGEYGHDGQMLGYEVFRKTLSHSMIFAFPGWWWDASEHMWQIKNYADMTADMQFPYPRTRYNNAAEVERWAKHGEVFGLAASKEEKETLANRQWEHNAGLLFPDDTVPARQTFIGLESAEGARENENGAQLVYQPGQFGMALGHSCPTTVWHPAESRFVKVDSIYMRGILLDQTGHFWPERVASDETSLHGSKSIWGLFHAYVISRQDCPADMPFVRIPFVAPLYLDALGWTTKEVAGSRPDFPDLKGTMNWTAAHRCQVADVILSTIAAIDDHRSVVHNFTRGHKKRKRGAKEAGAPTSQKRFQRVHMSSGPTVGRRNQPEMDVGLGDELAKRTLDHRVSVRAHERVYVRRGPKPLAEEDRLLLLHRGYRIYFNPEDMTYLDKRRLQIRAKKFPDGVHWTALKDVRVDQHERGPEDADLIPQVHVVNADVVTKALEWELSDDRDGHE